MWLIWVALACSHDTDTTEDTEPNDTDSPVTSEICVATDGLLSCEVADACHGLDTAEDHLDCRQTLSTFDHCDPNWQVNSGGVTDLGFVYAGSFGDGVTSDAPVFTITDEATWNAFVATWDTSPTLPAIDWVSNIVVVAQYRVSSTCGTRLVRHGIGLFGGYEIYPAVIYAEWEDSSGSCNAVCDMSQSSAVIYQVTRASGWPNVCASVINTCE